MNFARKCMLWTTLSALAGGCGGHSPVTKSTTVPPASRPVALEASEEELRDRYNAFARNLKSFNGTAELKPTTGSTYSGVISEYHEVKAFLLAARPYDIRMIGQVPVVGKTVFDMASDGQNFEVSIPPKNKFLEGPVSLERPGSKPMENLRPQHLVEALLWPEIRKEEQVVPEEVNEESARYYVLTVLRAATSSRSCERSGLTAPICTWFAYSPTDLKAHCFPTCATTTGSPSMPLLLPSRNIPAASASTGRATSTASK